MKRLLIMALLFAPIGMWACSGSDHVTPVDTPGNTETPGNETPEIYRIKITVDGREHTATLENNTIAKSFAATLPVTVDMSDFARAEKIFYTPEKLSAEGTAAGTRPVAGDIAYYAPWGNIAIFYKDASYSSSLYPVGRIDGNHDFLNVDGDIKNVSIELIKEN